MPHAHDEREGAPSAERDSHIALLTAAAETLGDQPAPLAARVHAALARTLYHSLEAGQMAQAAQVAEHAVALARGSGDTDASAEALLAQHDVRFCLTHPLPPPGSAALRRVLPRARLRSDFRFSFGDQV